MVMIPRILHIDYYLQWIFYFIEKGKYKKKNLIIDLSLEI